MSKAHLIRVIVGLTFVLSLGFLVSGQFLFSGDDSENKNDPVIKTKMAVAFGLDLSQGNTEAFGLTANLDFSWKSKMTEIVLSSVINYLETDGEKKADRMAFQALLDHRIGREFIFFVLGKPSRNLVQEIDFRLEAGMGFKFDLIDNYGNDKKDLLNSDLSVSMAIIYEFTNRLHDEREKLCRISFRPRFKQELSKNLEMEMMFFYQPDIRDFTNYRLLLDSKLQFNVSKNVSFLLKFIGEYNSVVPEGVEKQDYQLINQLKVSF